MNGITIRRFTFVLILLLVLYVMAEVFSGQQAFSYFFSPTPLFWFGILPLLLVFAYGLSLIFAPSADEMRTRIVLILSIGILVTVCTLQMLVRPYRPLEAYVHDGAIQTEEASHFLLQGKNPYASDYRGTAFGVFPDRFSDSTRPNPAWEHYVYLPGSFLIVAPWQWSLERFTGWFDVRALYLLFWIAFLLLLAKTVQAPWRDLAIILTALNPFMLKFIVAGLNDITVLLFLFLAALALYRGRYTSSGFALVFALLMKQSAWLFVPFYLVAVWQRRKPGPWRQVYRPLFPSLLLLIVVMGFFFLWSPGAFYDDVWKYANGSAELSYPASGLGIAQWMATFHVIDPYGHFPFWVFSLCIGIPSFLLLLRKSRLDISLQNIFWYYGFTLLVFWFFARYFNDTHLGYLALVFLLAALPYTSSGSSDQSKSVSS
ncbi:MAG: hypothetical protein H6760_04690 [Candidatus Nomurabacteria bacterium]|nr:MAG: hypothetical protein H6760_04690 [Candidatus Nomurabacteria bacterium]